MSNDIPDESMESMSGVSILQQFALSVFAGPSARRKLMLSEEAILGLHQKCLALQQENERLKDEVNTRYELAQERLGMIEDLRAELQKHVEACVKMADFLATHRTVVDARLGD